MVPLSPIAALLLLTAPAAALEVWSTDLPAALRAAQEKGTLVFVDLWGYPCPSCEYMDRNVLNTPQMMRRRDRLELVRLDASTPEGKEFSRSRRLIGIPIYMVLDPQGAELGITRGDMPAAKFFAWLEEGMARHGTKPEGKHTLASARAALNAYSLRWEYKEGIAFFESLPKDLRKQVDADPEAGASLQMLRLYAARDAKDGAACLAPAKQLTELKRGEIDAYELFVTMACSSYQPLEGQRRLKTFLEKPVKRLLEKRVQIAPEARGPDYKPAVEWSAQYYKVTGREDKARELKALLK